MLTLTRRLGASATAPGCQTLANDVSAHATYVFLPLGERRSNVDHLPEPACVWRCVAALAICGANVSRLATLCFLIWHKKNNRDWPQMSGDNSFLGGSLLGQRWFLRMFDARSCRSRQLKRISIVPKQIWTLRILDIIQHGQISHFLLPLKGHRAFLPLWVLNKRRCYFWHMPADWLQRPGETSVNWPLLVSISSAPVQSDHPIGPISRAPWRAGSGGYTCNVCLRPPKPLRVGGVWLEIKACNAAEGDHLSQTWWQRLEI